MKHSENIKQLALTTKGVVTASQVSNAGIPRHVLRSMTNSGALTQLERGIYLLDGFWEDEFYIYSQRYKKGVFSHGTALYVHGLTDLIPEQFTMTFPQSYNTMSLANPLLDIHRSIPSLFELGSIEMLSPSGNRVRVYDAERTLCDILRGSEADDSERARIAYQRYCMSTTRNIPRLMEYATNLKVTVRVRNYLKALL